MLRIRNTIILLVIIAAALVGIAKGLLYYYTNKVATTIQNTLPPGIFSYGSISTPLDGKASINDINIAIAGEIIKIKQVELVSHNILDPLHLMIKNWGSVIPKELAVNFKSISINTSSFFSNKLLMGNFAQYSLNIPCGNVNSLGLTEYIEMGLHHFISDVNLSYKLVTSKRIKINVSFNIKDIINSEISYDGDLANPLQHGILNNSTKQYIPQLEFHIIDYAFQRKLYNYCASKEKKSLDDYIKTVEPYKKELVDQSTINYFQLVLNDNVLEALRNYDKDPKDFYFALHPKGLIRNEELKKMNESVVLDLLRPELRINGKNVPLGFKWTNSSI